MKVKKYLAPTLQEAVAKMKAELGDEAVILSSGVLEPEITGGDKRIFEVIAAIDNPGRTLSPSPEESQAELLQKLKNGVENKQRKPEPLRQIKTQTAAPQPQIPQELAGIKAKISRAYTPRILEEDDEDIEVNISSQRGKKLFDTEQIKNELIDCDILPQIAKKIADEFAKQAPFIKTGNVSEYLLSTIASMIPTATFGVKRGKESKTIAVVGPTGVGKTTFISKLAVISKIIHKLDVGIITLDTYRLGALDQLKIFSQLSNIDYLVAYEQQDLPKLVAKFKKKDVIFIDTAGRSQNNSDMLEDIRNYLSTVKIDETFLVLNSGASTKNLFDMAKKFALLKYTGLVITKLDESASFGNLLNLAVKTNVPIKFLTNGQVIPDDIIAADADVIANLVYSGKLM